MQISSTSCTKDPTAQKQPLAACMPSSSQVFFYYPRGVQGQGILHPWPCMQKECGAALEGAANKIQCIAGSSSHLMYPRVADHPLLVWLVQGVWNCRVPPAEQQQA